MNGFLRDLIYIRGELGISIITYELVKLGWAVLRNMGLKGFNICAQKGQVQRTIEVQTTDPVAKIGKKQPYLQVDFSEAQRREFDFIVLCIYGYKDVFVIPLRALPKHKKYVHVGKVEAGVVYARSEYQAYHNAWHLLD